MEDDWRLPAAADLRRLAALTWRAAAKGTPAEKFAAAHEHRVLLAVARVWEGGQRPVIYLRDFDDDKTPTAPPPDLESMK
jgi:hypothetical protein